LQPDHALAHYNLGVIYDDEGKIEVAIREYKAAIRSAPDFAPAHVNLAVDLYEQGRYQDAWRHVREAERLGFAVNEDFIRALKTKMRREP
jgi:tetratricopeptide (TPR) repeat protein